MYKLTATYNNDYLFENDLNYKPTSLLAPQINILAVSNVVFVMPAKAGIHFLDPGLLAVGRIKALGNDAARSEELNPKEIKRKA